MTAAEIADRLAAVWDTAAAKCLADAVNAGHLRPENIDDAIAQFAVWSEGRKAEVVADALTKIETLRGGADGR